MRTIKITDVPPVLLDGIKRGAAKFVVVMDHGWLVGDVAVIGGDKYKVTYVHISTMTDGRAVLGIEPV